MQLRWYQEEALNALFEYLALKKGNPLIALPTGTGKSLVIAEFIRRIYSHYPNQRFLMLTHVKELIQQNANELLEAWPTAPLGIYSAGVGRKEHQFPITYAGIGTIVERATLFGHIDLVFIDEAHLVSPNANTMYRRFLEKMRKINPRIRVIGLTATKYRLRLGMLIDGGVFDDVCYDATTPHAFNRLLAEKFLSPLITKRTAMQYDLSNVGTSGGEYIQTELQSAMDIDPLTIAAVRETLLYGQDRKHCLVFASGVKHAEHVAETFRALGVQASYVHSDMLGTDRDKRIADFKAGKLPVLVNNTILTTGFNFPALDQISIMMATKSTGKWVQILGRGTRPAEGKKNCLILDFAGNTERLGPINDPVIPGKKGKGTGVAPVRLCGRCDTYSHASATSCEQCGEPFPRELKIKTTASSKEVMKDDTPVVEEFKVDRITYMEHRKIGGTPSLKVSYYCGLRVFHEWVCFEHTGGIRFKAAKWWKERTEIPVPETIIEALRNVNDIEEPRKIKVWVNAKHPEIINYDF